MKALKSSLLLFIGLWPISLPAQDRIPAEKLKRSECFFGVHFDLHASEDIDDAGKTLTYEMVDTFLARVRPDFVQIDCKGHPGISSYPTQVGFHVKGFEKDPLKLWREVTENNKVALFMHFSGVWDGKVVQEHPDWAVVKANGERSTQKVSFFSPYLDTYMIPQLKELSSVYHVDGAWIDGECWAVEPDYGTAAVQRFINETGITAIPRNPSDKYFPEYLEYTRTLFREHLKKYIDAIHQFNPGFQITSNWAYSSLMPEKVTVEVDFLSGDVTPQNGVYRSAFEARCLAPQGKPWDLMAWGFSWNGDEMPMTIKSAVQLKQEASEIMAMGGGVQFYFQQNRDLSIKPWIAYMLADIGTFCRQRQPYCHKAIAVPQIALLYPSQSYQRSAPVPYSRYLGMLQGALYALLDGQQAVEIIMEHNLIGKMNQYPLIVIPECDYLEPVFLDSLRSYVKNGGNLLVIGVETAEMFKPELGIVSSVKASRSEAFIMARGKIGSVRSERLRVNLAQNCKTLSVFYQGSDFNYPDTNIASSLNQVEKGKVAGIYFNAGTAYTEYKTPVIRDFLLETLQELMPDKLVEVTGSHLVHMSVNRMKGRLYVNLINTAGEHTNQNALGYDEVPPLKDITVSIRTTERPVGIVLQPDGRTLPFSYSNGRSTVLVTELPLHSVLEVINE
jgi:hypothetical protein